MPLDGRALVRRVKVQCYPWPTSSRKLSNAPRRENIAYPLAVPELFLTTPRHRAVLALRLLPPTGANGLAMIGNAFVIGTCLDVVGPLGRPELFGIGGRKRLLPPRVAVQAISDMIDDARPRSVIGRFLEKQVCSRAVCPLLDARPAAAYSAKAQ